MICKAALYLQGLIITLSTTHTIYNLRPTFVIITFTFGCIFQQLFMGYAQPIMSWGPDGLRQLFYSPSVRIHGFKLGKVCTKRPIWYL